MLTPRRFGAALALGLLIRTATLLLPGHDDVITWKIWSYAASHDVTAMYGIGGTPPTRGIVTWGDHRSTVDYPPFFLYEYAIVGRLYGALFPTYPDTLALLVAIKLPVLIASMGLTALLFVVVRRVSTRDEPAQWAAPRHLVIQSQKWLRFPPRCCRGATPCPRRCARRCLSPARRLRRTIHCNH